MSRQLASSHPFGDLISQILSRRHGLSQSKLAEGIGQDPAVVSAMCRGARLTGPQARERVLAIVRWFHDQLVLDQVDEANALLAAARMAALSTDPPGEAALLRQLSRRSSAQPREPRRRLDGNVPLLPSLFIGRDDVLADLKRQLTSPPVQPQPARVQVITAIRGWPGVGKTTVAAALAHDPDMSVVFPDGVLWASLGPTPDILSELGVWGRALGADEIVRSQTVKEASSQLAARLRERRMLLILDDVWEDEHATPFKVGGRNCALLITTRLPGVAQALAPTPKDIFRLPVLAEVHALNLLAALAPTVVADYPVESRELVRELEGLPLALQVAGHLLQVEASLGWGVSELLEELRSGVTLLQREAPPDLIDLASQTVPTVAVLLRRSTEHLDAMTRDCFALLGAFPPKPATFDVPALAAVWEVEDPKPIVRTLVERGLLEPVGASRFQMHALLVLHARSLLTG